jgi:hypothetical protein
MGCKMPLYIFWAYTSTFSYKSECCLSLERGMLSSRNIHDAKAIIRHMEPQHTG